MANETDYTISGEKDDSLTIAIILPCLFAIILVILMAVAFLLPKLTEESAETKENRRKKRLAALDNTIKAQHYVDWASKQRKEHPEFPVSMHPLCVICLDEIEDASQIRGLGCLHVFHQACLDDWFGRYNEYCPLCHRPIVGGKQLKKKTRASSDSDTPPVAFFV
ncbi:hypothetical protein CC78DRAFT_18566 [Lojkania enalia]|uniref:RING-type domain-containing protein n=1 Tax=Lojkania enalia TaxID=147567 RepID=A0A9P4KFL4_9PLEO|nr:hypothetical protein CC78DRAFT_18566 [Didymosphaeria enalia]